MYSKVSSAVVFTTLHCQCLYPTRSEPLSLALISNTHARTRLCVGVVMEGGERDWFCGVGKQGRVRIVERGRDVKPEMQK